MTFQAYRRRIPFLLGIIWLTFVVTQPTAVEAADLYSIIVADTLDESIGDSTAIDLDRMRREVQKIALYTDLDLKEVTLKGRDVTPGKVHSVLDELDIHSDDVVVFYFSGHGYRTAEKEGNPWPNLYFSRENKGMEYNFIGEKLEGYKPRFMLLIADACNSLIPDAWAPPLQRRMFGRVIDEELLKQNYKHLFLETSGIIMVTSSEAGEPSWDTGVGGLYTRAFIECLNQAVKSSALPSWETLLDTSAMKIAGEEQHPYYRIDLDISSLVSRGQLGLDTSP